MHWKLKPQLYPFKPSLILLISSAVPPGFLLRVHWVAAKPLFVRAFFSGCFPMVVSGCFPMVVKNLYITTACAGKAWQSSVSVWLFDLV